MRATNVALSALALALALAGTAYAANATTPVRDNTGAAVHATTPIKHKMRAKKAAAKKSAASIRKTTPQHAGAY